MAFPSFVLEAGTGTAAAWHGRLQVLINPTEVGFVLLIRAQTSNGVTVNAGLQQPVERSAAAVHRLESGQLTIVRMTALGFHPCLAPGDTHAL